MEDNRKGRTKPFLLIIEGAQGAGKGTISTAIRNKVTCTNLISLAGLPISSSKELVYRTRLAELDMLKDIGTSGLNIVMDRSFLSDRVFQLLGKKPYTAHEFDEYFYELLKKLRALSDYYDIHIVLLTASREAYYERHKKRMDKPVYENLDFSAGNSVLQQYTYSQLFKELKRFKELKFHTVSTKALKSDTVNKVLKLINR